MPAFGVGGGENQSLIEIVTTYRDEASAGMAATGKAATEMGAAIQSASGIAEMSIETFRALGGPEAIAGGKALTLPAGFGEAGVSPESTQAIQGVTAAVVKLGVATETTSRATVTMMSLWRLRAVAGIVRQVEELGDQILVTAQAWVVYAARAEEAANVTDNVVWTHGELTTLMKEQEEAAARMGEELGASLLPAYKDSIRAVISLQQAVADLSDGWQSAIGIGTTLVGVFLKVAGAIALAGVAALTAKAIFMSLGTTLGIDMLAMAGVIGGLALTLGAVGVAIAAVVIGISKSREYFKDFAAGFREAAESANLSAAEIRVVAQAWYDSLNVMDKAIASLHGGVDALVDAVLNAGDSMSTVYEAAAKSVEAMILPAAQAFQSLADAQEDIQNEMLTKRREYAKVMADIDKYGYSEQRVAQADALNAQIRQLELADMQAVKAHERQMGQIVSQTISAFERVGSITPEMAFEAQMAAAIKFGTATPETIEAGTAFLEEQFPGVMGAEAGGRVAPPETAQVTALEDNTTRLGEVRDAIYDWLEGVVNAGSGAWVGGGGGGGGAGGVGRTVTDELVTQGVRLR